MLAVMPGKVRALNAAFIAAAALYWTAAIGFCGWPEWVEGWPPVLKIATAWPLLAATFVMTYFATRYSLLLHPANEIDTRQKVSRLLMLPMLAVVGVGMMGLREQFHLSNELMECVLVILVPTWSEIMCNATVGDFTFEVIRR